MTTAAVASRPALTPGAVFGWLLLVAFAATLVALAFGVLITGLGTGYYLLPFEARPDHPWHPTLRPGGTVGVLLGTLGTGLMVAMLSYSVRKLFPPVGFLGTPAWWLRFHMICGIMGPVLIVLHGGLYLPSGIVAVAFWCMLLVSFSGTFGRYVYGHFPRTAAGKEMDHAAAREALSDLRAELVGVTGSADADAAARIGEAVELASDFELKARGALDLVRLDLEVRRRTRRIRALLGRVGLPPTARRRALRTLRSQLRMTRNLGAWQVTRRLFRYWHLFHEPLAKAMYLIAAWHIFNAVVFGGALQTLMSWVP